MCYDFYISWHNFEKRPNVQTPDNGFFEKAMPRVSTQGPVFPALCRAGSVRARGFANLGGGECGGRALVYRLAGGTVFVELVAQGAHRDAQ